MIYSLKDSEVFVFGSNLAGRHGAGAAKTAHQLFGAKMGVGNGPTGKCYGIPTKDHNIRTLPLKEIALYVEQFLTYTRENPDKTFLVTPIGCGLAGYKPHQIAPMFANHSQNVILPREFRNL